MITSCFQYHVSTSYDRYRMEGHGLDWENQPSVFKEYPGLKSVPLPEPGPFPEKRLSELLRQDEMSSEDIEFDITALSTLLFLCYSLTGKARQGEGYFYFRSVPSAGALYPAELYLLSNGLAGLDDALYHFSIAHHGLHLLREGQQGKDVEPGPGLTFFLTSIFFRSCWKYRDRGYRYCLLDTGHLLQSLVLAAGCMGIPLSCSADFPDEQVNQFLGLDPQREVCLAVAWALGGKEAPPVTLFSAHILPREFQDASRVAPREKVYPAAIEAHRAGMTLAYKTKESFPAMVHELGPCPGRWESLKPVAPWPETVGYKDTVLSRRSRRNFVQKPMAEAAVTGLIDGLVKGASENAGQFVGTGVLVNSAKGRKPGFYLLDLEPGDLGLVKEGPFVENMARICLDQAWLAHAALHFLFMADLGALEER
ncbi:MAG: SagB family peptide dehydrogenase, partial [Deltaproteobacteria bacterium]|nr:SagB family peptide dehydrogenase [Deltaproteobacteria bacterium]